VKKVLNCIFFTNNGPAIQNPVPKGKSVTAKFYKNVVLKKLQKYFYKRRPKHGLKYVSLLHDNASSHKAQIVADFLKQQKVRVLPQPAYSPDFAPCDYFCFRDLNLSSLESVMRPEKHWALQLASPLDIYLLRIMKSAFIIGLKD